MSYPSYVILFVLYLTFVCYTGVPFCISTCPHTPHFSRVLHNHLSGTHLIASPHPLLLTTSKITFIHFPSIYQTSLKSPIFCSIALIFFLDLFIFFLNCPPHLNINLFFLYIITAPGYLFNWSYAHLKVFLFCFFVPMHFHIYYI